jgi:hypothetical protein
VLRTGVDSCDNTTIRQTWGMTLLVHLPGIFDKHRRQNTTGHPGLIPEWKNVTDQFIASVKPHVASGCVLGVNMGDEICCGGVPYLDMSIVAARLKAGLPDALIYINECTNVQGWPSLNCSNGGGECTGGVPAGLDAISIDLYDRHNTDGHAEVFSVKVFYHHHMYPRLHPHQRVLFVPGVFALDPVHCAAKNGSCPLDKQAVQVVDKLDGFFDWAKNDSRVLGFNPWHFDNRSDEHSLGAVSMPSVMAKLKQIGHYIINGSTAEEESDRTSAAPSIYWTSTPTLVNETLLISGAGLDHAQVSLCSGHGEGGGDGKCVALSESDVSVWAHSIKLVLPTWCAPPCSVEIKAPGVQTVTVAANRPDVWWGASDWPLGPDSPIGPSVTPVLSAGGTLRVFGRALAWTEDGTCVSSAAQLGPVSTTTLTLTDAVGMATAAVPSTAASCYEATFELPVGMTGDLQAVLTTPWGASTPFRVTVTATPPAPAPVPPTVIDPVKDCGGDLALAMRRAALCVQHGAIVKLGELSCNRKNISRFTFIRALKG